jgi:hypothetical protein
MLRNRIKNTLLSIIIISSGIGIPVVYHTYKEEKQKITYYK